jgi:hypothetical protein
MFVAFAAGLFAFLAYSSIYAYRKPFTVATFEGLRIWGISYQTLLIKIQLKSYKLSNFFEIKIIAELKRIGRWRISILLIGIAWVSLLVFAILPAPWGMICLFINGFVLGFMWGIVFSYIEGRRATDFIGAAMAVSFIFAGGFTRSIAKWVMIGWGVSEQWMPFVTGLVFIIPLLLFIYLLEKIPPPDKDDIKERTERRPMSKAERRKFLQLFAGGITMVAITYLFLTIMRDIRDNYMANIWNELGYGNNYAVFTQTETITSLVVLLIIGLLVLVRKNMQALRVSHFVILVGLLLAGISSWFFIMEKISGLVWMQLVSLGLYMGYIPFNCIFFERMIAVFRIGGNVGFLIYLIDAFGYLGSVLVMLSKEFVNWQLNWSQFYSYGVIAGSIISIAGITGSWFYFNRKYVNAKIGEL